MKEKKQMKAPHVFVLVLIMIVCATLLTYVLPAGSYNRYVDESTGTTLVESGSYQRIEQTPVSLFAMLESIPKGLVDAASVVTIVLMYGGAFGIINSTKVIECGIASSIEKMRRYSTLIIPVFMILFSLLGAMLGICESCMAFIPLCIITYIIVMAFCCIVCYYSTMMVIKYNNTGSTTTNVRWIKMSWIFFQIPLNYAIYILFEIEKIWGVAAGKREVK